MPAFPSHDRVLKEILSKGKLCPIIHCPSWIAERGIMDRFWTVFATGRFGVCDNAGIYEFFDEDEVVCAEDPAEYVDKSLYYAENVDKQLPFIEIAQKRIKEEFNFYVTWPKIIEDICNES